MEIVVEEIEEVTPKHPCGVLYCGVLYAIGGTSAPCT